MGVIAVALASLLFLAPGDADAGKKGMKKRARADLVVAKSGIARLPNSAFAGEELTILTGVGNEGKKTAKASSVGLLLSKNKKVDRGDVEIGSAAVKSLKPRRFSGIVKVRLSIPATTGGGNFRVFSCADIRKEIKEKSEKNNCGWRPLRVIALPELAFSPASHDFGEILDGTTSEPFNFKVTNVGDYPAPRISNVNMTFDFVVDDGCAGLTLAVGASCNFGVTFRPVGPGLISGKASVFMDDALPTPGATISGTALQGAFLEADPGHHQFDATIVGDTKSQMINFTNTGPDPSAPLEVSLSTPGGNFSIGPTNTCAEVVLQPSGSCQVQARYHPTGFDEHTTDLLVRDSAHPDRIWAGSALSGLGTPP